MNAGSMAIDAIHQEAVMAAATAITTTRDARDRA